MMMMMIFASILDKKSEFILFWKFGSQFEMHLINWDKF